MAKLKKVSKYRRKLFYNFFFLFVAFGIAIGSFQYRREKIYRTQQLESDLKTYVQLTQQFIAKNKLFEKNNFLVIDSLRSVIPRTDIRITVIDAKGEVLYDSFVEDFENLENHYKRPEVQESMVSEYGSSIRHSASTGRDYYYFAIDYHYYFVRAALPYNIQVENYLKVDTLFIYTLLLFFVIAALFLIYLSDKFGQSISKLQTFAIKAGNDEPIDLEEDFPKNELGIIGRQIVEVYGRLQKAKDDLSAEREKLFRHLQISHEGIAVFSKEKKQLLANNHFVQYLNSIADEPAMTPNKFFNIKELKPINDFIDENLNGSQSEKNDLSSNILTVQKNGKYYVVQVIVFQDSSFEISINNVTKLEKEKKLKQQMTSNIAHELKTPVSSILGYLETILTSEVEADKQKFFLERSYLQTQRLSNLIQDISLLNKIEEAGDLFKVEQLNVKDIVTLVIDDLRLKIEEKNMGVKLELHENLFIMGNRSVFYSIWRNLVENSINYAGENITINIKNYLEDEQYLYFSYSDNGPGIPEKHLARIFERFYRIDSGRARTMGGTGLGLAIVKNGVLFHKGEISVKNLKKGGLEFVFTVCRDINAVF